MSGVTKHIFNQEVRDILSMWDCEIKTIEPLLPKEYSSGDIITLLKEFYPHEWHSVEIKYVYYQTKEFLKEVYPFETYEIPQNPNELEYRIENSREQKIKEYDFFISHSSKDGTIVQKLIRAENQNGKNIFCDWINDVDYLKRHLLCEATLKVLEKRMEQSKAMIFVVSENSRNSVWCKYELKESIRTVRGEPLISYKLSLIVLFYQQRALCAKVSVL